MWGWGLALWAQWMDVLHPWSRIRFYFYGRRFLLPFPVWMASVRLELVWMSGSGVGRLLEEGSWHRGCHSLQQGHTVAVTGGAQRCPQHVLLSQFAGGDTGHGASLPWVTADTGGGL